MVGLLPQFVSRLVSRPWSAHSGDLDTCGDLNRRVPGWKACHDLIRDKPLP
jgi:hypothetical protein